MLAQRTLHRLRDLVSLLERRSRVVPDRQDVLAADADAADVVVPIDELLEDHRLRSGLVERGDQLLDGVDDEHVLPAPTGVGLEHGRHARVRNDVLPVQRELKVAQRPDVVDVRDVLLVGQHDGLRDRDAQTPRQRALEELLVRLPPEGVVDDDRPHQRDALQVRAEVGHLVRDAVDENRVTRLRVLGRAAQDSQLGADALGGPTLVDLVDERSREGVLASDQESDLLVSHHQPSARRSDDRRRVASHHLFPVGPIVRPAGPEIQLDVD